MPKPYSIPIFDSYSPLSPQIKIFPRYEIILNNAPYCLQALLITNLKKQDKYTMDPGHQIYLSNNKKLLVNNDF